MLIAISSRNLFYPVKNFTFNKNKINCSMNFFVMFILVFQVPWNFPVSCSTNNFYADFFSLSTICFVACSLGICSTLSYAPFFLQKTSVSVRIMFLTLFFFNKYAVTLLTDKSNVFINAISSRQTLSVFEVYFPGSLLNISIAPLNFF